MPAEFDDLSRRLSGLESDVSRVHMAGPAAARRRGRQRTRNRAVAAGLGAAAAVAVGFGVVNALPQATPTIPDPAESPTIDDTSPTPDDTTTPPPDEDVQETENVLADLLLGPDELGALKSHWWGESEWVAQSGRRPRDAELACFPIFGQPPEGATGSAFATFQADALEKRADEEIWTFASDTAAANALIDFRDSLGLCATGRDDVDLTNTWEYDGIGDASFQSLMFPPDIDGAAHIAIVGAARTGSTLVVTATDFGSQEAYSGEPDMLAAAVAKVCGGDCVGDITQRQTYPEAALDSDLFLLDDDVNPVGGYDDFVRSDTRSDPGRYMSFCLPELVYAETEGRPSSEPAQVGGEAPTIYQAEWFGPSEGSVHETVMQFLDGQEAAGFMANYAELPDQCGDVVETHEQVVNQPERVQVSGADEALVWTINETVLPTDLGSEGGFSGVGMARSGSYVVVIGFAAFGDPTTGTGGTWTDYATETLALALDRAQS